MENKVVYITGGSKGIGYGIAEVLLKNGYQVAVSGRNEADVLKAAESLSSISNNVLGLVSDVKNYNDEASAVEKIVEKFGRLDAVVANAGMGVFKPVDQLSLEDWNNMIETNLTGVFHSLKASVEQLKINQGYFISMASLAGTNFFENGSGYNASKFGVVGFTQAVMMDLRKYNVKVSTIMPGSVSSYFNGHKPSEADAWKIQPEDLGNLVLDLFKMNPRSLPSKVEIRPTRPDSKS